MNNNTHPRLLFLDNLVQQVTSLIKSYPIASIVIAFVLVSSIFAIANQPKGVQSAAAYSEEKPYVSESDYKENAYYFSQIVVKESLKSPKSASFPDAPTNFSSTENNEYIIGSYVDAVNAFGVEIRKRYYCRLRFKGGDITEGKNWELKDFAFVD